MDYRGAMCTLYPVSWQGAVVLPTQFDVRWAADAYQGALVAELSKAGLSPRLPVAGALDLDIIIRSQIVRADPGNRFLRWMFSLLAGGASFEVEGQVGDRTAPFGQFNARGVRRWAYAGGNSQDLLNDAGKLAGQEAARQILATLAAR